MLSKKTSTEVHLENLIHFCIGVELIDNHVVGGCDDEGGEKEESDKDNRCYKHS